MKPQWSDAEPRLHVSTEEKSHRKSKTAAAAPTTWMPMKAGASAGRIPAKVSLAVRLEASTDPSMGRLSTALGVDLSTMSRNVSVLQREGYVERAHHPDDSRVVTVALTRKGANALETLRCDEKDVMAKLYNRIPAASRATALRALEQVPTALEPEVETAAPCCAADQPGKASRTQMSRSHSWRWRLGAPAEVVKDLEAPLIRQAR